MYSLGKTNCYKQRSPKSLWLYTIEIFSQIVVQLGFCWGTFDKMIEGHKPQAPLNQDFAGLFSYHWEMRERERERIVKLDLKLKYVISAHILFTTNSHMATPTSICKGAGKCSLSVSVLNWQMVKLSSALGRLSTKPCCWASFSILVSYLLLTWFSQFLLGLTEAKGCPVSIPWQVDGNIKGIWWAGHW